MGYTQNCMFFLSYLFGNPLKIVAEIYTHTLYVCVCLLLFKFCSSQSRLKWNKLQINKPYSKITCALLLDVRCLTQKLKCIWYNLACPFSKTLKMCFGLKIVGIRNTK